MSVGGRGTPPAPDPLRRADHRSVCVHRGSPPPTHLFSPAARKTITIRPHHVSMVSNSTLYRYARSRKSIVSYYMLSCCYIIILFCRIRCSVRRRIAVIRQSPLFLPLDSQEKCSSCIFG